MESGECSHSGQWTVDSGQWRVKWRVVRRVESEEWRVESVVRSGEEAPGERSPPNFGDYTTEFHLDWYLCLLSKLSFVNLQQTLD